MVELGSGNHKNYVDIHNFLHTLCGSIWHP